MEIFGLEKRTGGSPALFNYYFVPY